MVIQEVYQLSSLPKTKNRSDMEKTYGCSKLPRELNALHFGIVYTLLFGRIDLYVTCKITEWQV